MPRVIFFAPPGLTPLDLIGPLQAFQGVGAVGGPPYEIVVSALAKSLPVEGNLHFSNLIPFRKIKLVPDDILFVAGFSGKAPHKLPADPRLYEWIRRSHEAGATVCSCCTGSYLLAEAGILDHAACATHWADVDDMQARYPQVEVRRATLFVEAGRVLTSAGVASGIDLAIHVIGQRHGPKTAFAVARYLVIYLRRSGDFDQESIYLKYRNHLDDTVHRAQNVMIENLARPPRLEDLAQMVGSSARNLSRRFQQSIGLSIGEFRRKLQLEHARALLQEEGSKVDDVARACGFSGPRQLRNLYHHHFGRSPRERPELLHASGR